MRRCGQCGRRYWFWQVGVDFAEISFHEACYYVWQSVRHELFEGKRRDMEKAIEAKRLEMEAFAKSHRR